MRKIILACLVGALISGCAVNTLKYDAIAPKEGEAIVVVGLNPSNTKIIFHEAIVDNGFVREKSVFEKGVGGYPLGGYVPFVVKSDTFYKMSYVTLFIGDRFG